MKKALSLIGAIAALTFCTLAAAQTTSSPAAPVQAPDAAALRGLFQAQAPAGVMPVGPPPAVAVAAPAAETPPVPQAQTTDVSLAGAPMVYGQWLFQGNFAQQSFRGSNPQYAISIGDSIDLNLWGAFSLQTQLVVDAQGNIFLPQVGPVRVAGIRNDELNDVVSRNIKRKYRENVEVYANLSASQPVKVFVGGGVRRPGLYAASASDSVLYFLDRAGGIDPRAGSYLDVRVIRADQSAVAINLYDFLNQGKLPLLQFHDGDTIFVGPLRSTASVTGLVARQSQFEFDGHIALTELLRMAGVSEQATNVRITRNRGSLRQAQYVAVGPSMEEFQIEGGDQVEVIADRLVGSILVTVEGEHAGSGQFVLPYKATLDDVLQQIKFSDQSNRSSVQLFRKSIAVRQKQMLDETLQKLEQAALSARSWTNEEASLRTQDSRLLLEFIDRARAVVPLGQLILPSDVDAHSIALEDGDIIRIPRVSNMVAVHGEVYLPNAFVYRSNATVSDYIDSAGGMSQSGNEDRVIIMSPSGEVRVSSYGGFSGGGKLKPGDEVLVLPKVDTKRFQFGKDVVQVLYQIAVAAGVVLRL